jgi:hypothetical protein
VRTAHRITIDPFGWDVLAASALNRVINAQYDRAFRHKPLDQQSEQQTAGGAPTPVSTAQHPVLIDKAALPAQADDPQTTRDGALSRSEYHP